MLLNDYKVPDKELRVTMVMEFGSQSLGAQTSATDTAHKGIKPKVFNVSLVIAFADAKQLTALMTVAQKTRMDGALQIYDITDETANALKVRQVRFADSFNVREAGSLKAWTVQFALQEYQSVPEKMEKRQGTATPQAQAVGGTTVGESDSSEEAPVSGFESLLAKMDKALS